MIAAKNTWARGHGYAVSRKGIWHLLREPHGKSETKSEIMVSACGFMEFIPGRVILLECERPANAQRTCRRCWSLAEKSKAGQESGG